MRASIGLVALLAACGVSSPPSLENSSPENVNPKRANDDDLAEFAWHHAGSEKTPGVVRIEQFLEGIEPGWVATYDKLREADGAQTLARFSAHQKGEDTGTLPNPVRDHLLALANKHPRVLDAQILVRLIDDAGMLFDFEPLIADFGDRPKLWWWLARLSVLAEGRLEAAFRCLGLDQRYPGCLAAYNKASDEFRSQGCANQHVSDQIHVVVLARPGATEEPLLRRDAVAGIWLERSNFGHEHVAIYLRAEHVSAASARIANSIGAEVITRLGETELARAKIVKAVKLNSLDGGDSLEGLCTETTTRQIPEALRWPR